MHLATCWSEMMCVPCTKNKLMLMTIERDGLGGQLLGVQQDCIVTRRQLADEQARIDCATRGGWLSDDLECAGEDGPACWNHLLAEARAEIKGLKELAWNYYDFTPNCGDDNKCFACGEQWFPNKCSPTCSAKLIFQATKEANSSSIVWLELCDKLEEAQKKLEAVERVLDDDSGAASGVRHEVRASYMNSPHSTVDIVTCRSDCPRCALDRILHPKEAK